MNLLGRVLPHALLSLFLFGVAAPGVADVSINSGGPATGSYLADQNFTGGSAYTFGNQTGVYNTERWSTTGFSYAIPVTAGQVEVTLRFRESCTQCSYKRVFQVQAEGQVVLSNYSVPLNTVADRTFTVTTDATLNLVFTTINGESWVNAIEVRQLTPAPVVTLSASPTSVASGGSSTLTWSSTNATSCTASGAWSGAKATSGSTSTGPLAATSTYTLTCTGVGGSASQSATVTVTGAVPVVTLSASPTSVASGGSSTLTWSSTNATSCTASGAWRGAKATSGSQSTGSLNATRTYTLTCTGAGGSASQSATVTVVPSPGLTLSASPTSVASGGSSTLTWSSTNATSCTASGAWSGTKPLNGSENTGPLAAAASYTLTCSGIGGSRTRTVSVGIITPPTATLSASPTTVASGGSSTLTWSSTNATSCTASGAWSGAKATSGSTSTGPLAATSTYTLTCTGVGGSASQSATVTVTGAVPVVTLSASPTSVASGGSSTLTWSSTNATSCTASGAWSGAQATSGSQSTGPNTIASFYSLTCVGDGGSASAAVNVSVIGPGASPVFPLRVEVGKRYLVDSSGSPFLIHGDSPWSLAVQLTREDVDVYLENRRLKGFNTILMNLIEHEFATHPPLNAYGVGPFLVPGDFSMPNETYFEHVEYVISRAAAEGFLVILFPAYMGFGGGEQGWYREMQANGVTKLRAYGQYVANRFRSYDNIVWAHGGDYNPPELDLMRAVVNGIRDVDTRWLHTFHGVRGTEALRFLGSVETWLQINSIYTDSATVVASAFQAYNRSQMPFFLIEAIYENEGATQATVRKQAYQAVLSGSGGQMMGNNPIWMFGVGWQAALESGGAQTLSHLRTLLEARSWSTLQPDLTGVVLTGGIGADAGRAVAALATDRSSAIIYAPDIRSLTVNMGQIAGPNVIARWYDPSAGTYTTIAGSPFLASGSQTFTPVGNNDSGFGDWVLVLESVP